MTHLWTAEALNTAVDTSVSYTIVLNAINLTNWNFHTLADLKICNTCDFKDIDWTNKRGSSCYFSLIAGWLRSRLRSSRGMSLSGSLLCFLFPPLPSCHFPGQTNKTAGRTNAPTLEVQQRMDPEPSQLWKGLSIWWDWGACWSLTRFSEGNIGDRLSAWSRIHCVEEEGASSHLTFRSRWSEVYDVLNVILAGHEEVADLNYVTKADTGHGGWDSLFKRQNMTYIGVFN